MKTTTTSDRVRKMMQALGNLDQPSFGRLAGASKSVVNQWLSGATKSITAQYAFQLQRTTGYNAEWIQTGNGPEKMEASIETASHVAETAAEYKVSEDLLDRYRKASAAARVVVDLALRAADSRPNNCPELLFSAVRMAILAAESHHTENQAPPNRSAA